MQAAALVNAVPAGAEIAPDLVAAIAATEMPAGSEPVDQQLTELAKPRRNLKKPRDYTNIIIVVLAIGVLVMVPLMFLVLR